MTINETFGTCLRTIRKHRGISQEKLAEQANKSVEAISNLERGLSLPSYEMILALAEALSIPAADFFLVEGEAHGRTALISTLVATARQLSDKDLRVAVGLIKTLEQGQQ